MRIVWVLLLCVMTFLLCDSVLYAERDCATLSPVIDQDDSRDGMSSVVSENSKPYMSVDELLEIIHAAGYESPEKMCMEIISLSWQEDIEEGLDFQYGSEGRVYMVPNIQEFCLKVMSFEEYYLEPIAVVPDIYPGANVGQVIATIGVVQVLRKQRGMRIAVDPDFFQSYLGDENEEELRRYHASLMQKIVSMPQAAFDDFAQTIRGLNSRGYFFDAASGGNVLLDTKNKRFNIVDVGKGRVENSVSDIVKILGVLEETILYALKGVSTYDRRRNLLPYTTDIIEKCYIAAHAAGMPFVSPEDIATSVMKSCEDIGVILYDHADLFMETVCAAEIPAGYGTVRGRTPTHGDGSVSHAVLSSSSDVLLSA